MGNWDIGPELREISRITNETRHYRANRGGCDNHYGGGYSPWEHQRQNYFGNCHGGYNGGYNVSIPGRLTADGIAPPPPGFFGGRHHYYPQHLPSYYYPYHEAPRAHYYPEPGSYASASSGGNGGFSIAGSGDGFSFAGSGGGGSSASASSGGGGYYPYEPVYQEPVYYQPVYRQPENYANSFGGPGGSSVGVGGHGGSANAASSSPLGDNPFSLSLASKDLRFGTTGDKNGIRGLAFGLDDFNFAAAG